MKTVQDIVPWLQEVIAHFYPDSSAQSLDAGVKARAENTVLPSTADRRAGPLPALRGSTCQHPGGFDELFAFTCLRCGSFVEVPRRRCSEPDFARCNLPQRICSPPFPVRCPGRACTLMCFHGPGLTNRWQRPRNFLSSVTRPVRFDEQFPSLQLSTFRNNRG